MLGRNTEPASGKQVTDIAQTLELALSDNGSLTRSAWRLCCRHRHLLRPQDARCYPVERAEIHLVNLLAHFFHRNLLTVRLDLTAQILDFDQPRFERHDERTLELVLSAIELGLCNRALVDGAGAKLKLACNDVDNARIEAGMDRGRDAKKARVGITMVEGSTVVDAVMLIEHIGVEPRIHAFARSTGAEAATAAKEDL